MDIKKIKAVAFDCDGVMFDTSVANRKYYDEVLALYGKAPLTDEQFVKSHMMTVKNAIEYLFPGLEDLSGVYKNIAKIGYTKFLPYMNMEKGLPELLQLLKDKGYIRAVATNRTNSMEQLLKLFGLENFFDIVVTALTVKKPKPDPEQLELIMKTYRLKPEHLLFIGDSEYDQLAAKSAQVCFVAFGNPNLEADIHVDSMDHIAEIFKPKNCIRCFEFCRDLI
jgi:phosphoglycolate phosphatase